jgi:hypothetical protein
MVGERQEGRYNRRRRKTRRAENGGRDRTYIRLFLLRRERTEKGFCLFICFSLAAKESAGWSTTTTLSYSPTSSYSHIHPPMRTTRRRSAASESSTHFSGSSNSAKLNAWGLFAGVMGCLKDAVEPRVYGQEREEGQRKRSNRSTKRTDTRSDCGLVPGPRIGHRWRRRRQSGCYCRCGCGCRSGC